MHRLSILLLVGLGLVFLSALLCPGDASAGGFTTRYDQDIKSAVLKWWPGHDWLWWKAQLYQESLLNPAAVSPVGARGLAQFMPGTWADMCGRLKWGTVSPHVAKYSIEAGAYYMARLVKGWSSKRPVMDRWDLARASYNAGMGNLIKAQKVQGGAMLYADIIKGLPQVTGHHSRETITYVQRIHRWYKEMVCGHR